MTEFAFDGGSRGANWSEHAQDRARGMLGYGGAGTALWAATVTIDRVKANGLTGSLATGFVALTSEREVRTGESLLQHYGGGLYLLRFQRQRLPHELECSTWTKAMRLPGESLPLPPNAVPHGYYPPTDEQIQEALVGLSPQVGLCPQGREGAMEDPCGAAEPATLEATTPWTPKAGDTVWLELSREGPYKVIGPYHNPRGTEIPACRPGDAPNVQVVAHLDTGLWLCQDRKGKVHILAAGSLTPVEPTGWLGHVNGNVATAAAWCWDRREAALWLAATLGIVKILAG